MFHQPSAGAEPSAPNSSFSTVLPTLQLALDSTSIGEFKTCSRKYYYRIICGWSPRSQSIHLTWGLWMHQGREFYEHWRLGGDSHEEALRRVVHWALTVTWNSELNRPLALDHKYKNRLTLVRSLVWYLDQFQNDSLKTVILQNGRPAVELSFRYDSGLTSLTDEPILFCGHLDRIVTLGDDHYISDLKTTGGSIGPGFFAQYSPDNQMSMYTLAGQIAFQTPVRGVIVDGVQVAVGFNRFERGLVPRTQDQLTEWLSELGQWITLMGRAAESGSWPMNDKACHHYGGCEFRSVCSRTPSARDQWLATDFVKRTWDPLQVRGDV